MARTFIRLFKISLAGALALAAAGAFAEEASLFEENYPLISAEPSLVCSDTSYIDAEGSIRKGERPCENLSKLKPEFIKAGVSIGSITGTLEEDSEIHKTCTSDGEENCLTSQNFPAAKTEGLAAKVLSSQTVAGVLGTALGEGHSLCTGSQQTGCVTSGSYPPMDLTGASLAVSDLTSTQFNTAVAGAASFEFWDSLGNRHQLSGDLDLNPSTLRSGLSIFGVSGNVAPAPALCSADGGVACVATSSFAAMLKSGAPEKLLSGQSAGGVSGNVNLPLASKVLSGIAFGSSGALSGTLTLPPASQVLSGSGAFGAADAPLTPTYTPDFPDPQNVRSGATVNGSPGSLVDCTGPSQSSCVATSTYKSMDLSAAGSGSASGLTLANFNLSLRSADNFEFWDASGARHQLTGDTDLSASNVQSGIEIFGITGALTASPPTCSSDGEANCLIDGISFKAGALLSAASKLRVGQSLAGVSGNVVLPNAAKVLSGTAYGISGTSLTGTLTLPNASNVLSGSSAYGEAGALVSPSYSPDFPSPSLVRSSDTVNGSPGTLADCNGGNQSGCVTTANYKAMDLTTASAMSDLTASNFNATIASSGNFEFWDSTGARHEVSGDSNLTAANILSGSSIFGVTGSATPAPANCAASGSQACVVSGSYYAGSSCTANASNCYLPAYQLGSQPLKAISYDAIDAGKASISAALSLGGVTGTLPLCSSGAEVSCITSANYKSMDLSAAGTDTGLTAANFNSRVANAGASEFWDAGGARHSISGDADLSAANVKASVNLLGTSGQYPSGSYPLASDTAATDFTLFTTQLTSAGSFEFFDSSGAVYSGSGDADLVASNILSAVAIESLSITGSYTSSLSCPSGWIKVPADSAYGTGHFCVMKYEAKNVSSVATAQAANTPWVSISQASALSACRALGVGYDLISNPQWMTIGSNIAGIAGNWTGGSVGSGTLFAGHSDSNPNAACGASSNDSLYYVESTCTPVGSGDNSDQRRTLSLSNSNVIWDFSANVWESTTYLNRGDKPGATDNWFEYSALSGTTTTPLKDFVPTNAVKSYWSDTWNSTKWIGRYWSATNGTGGVLGRGGDWADGTYTGVFTAGLGTGPTEATTDLGFRCTMTAP